MNYTLNKCEKPQQSAAIGAALKRLAPLLTDEKRLVASAFVGERYQRQQLLEVAEVSVRLRLLIQFLRAQMGENI